MPAISSYYAQVGVGIDQKSIAQVRKYLDSIEKQFTSFQSRLSKVKPVSIRVTIDRTKAMTLLQRDLNAIGKTAQLNIKNVNFSRAEVQRKLNAALSHANGNTRIRMGALLSRESLTAMKDQIRGAINGLVVSPTINPRIRQATVRGGRGGGGGGSGGGGGGHGSSFTNRDPNGKRNFSPWHNPMMVGGGAGAFIRYGPYSLPFIAGAMGLNALTNKAQTLESQQLLLNASTGNKQVAAGQMKFLSGVGDRLGLTTETLAPFYAQMFAGARGTKLEGDLPKGFESFLEYSSVVGLNGEQMKGSIRAISQMIAKRGIYSEELRQQLAEHGMPMAMQIMADAVAGGDMKKLSKMMEQGQVDPIEALPKFFAALKKEAAPFLQDFYKTIARNRGTAEKATEDWMKKFLGGGVSEGLADFFKVWTQLIKDSIPHAERLGEIFKGTINYFNAALLAPGEFIDWWNGIDTSHNFMTVLFGKSSASEFVETVKKAFRQIEYAVGDSMFSANVSIASTRRELELLSKVMTPVIRLLGNLIEQAGAPTMEAAKKIEMRQNNERLAREATDNLPLTPEQKKAKYDEVLNDLNAKTAASIGSRGVNATHDTATIDALANYGKTNGVGGSTGWLVNKIMGLGTGAPTANLPTGNIQDTMPLNIPNTTPSPGSVQAAATRLDVVLSGTIKVDGAVSDDITFSESIRGGIEGILQDHFRNSLGNSAHGVQ